MLIRLSIDSEPWRARDGHEKHDGDRQRILRNACGRQSMPLLRGPKAASSGFYKLQFSQRYSPSLEGLSEAPLSSSRGSHGLLASKTCSLQVGRQATDSVLFHKTCSNPCSNISIYFCFQRNCWQIRYRGERPSCKAAGCDF